jgi:hypothetical protein
LKNLQTAIILNRHIIYGILLFISSLFFANEKYYLVLPAVVFILEFNAIKNFLLNFKSKIKQNKYLFLLVLPLLFYLFSVINKFTNGNEIYSLKDYYSSFYLFLPLLFISYFVSNKTFYKTIVVLISFEIVIGLIEYFVSNVSFFIKVPEGNWIHSKSVLYDSRVFGLSLSSSIFALKVFCGVLILEFTKFSKTIKFCLRIILMIGIIITFNRAVLLAVFLFWFIFLIRILVKDKSIIKVVKSIGFSFGLFFIVFYCFSRESFNYQFFRGEDSSKETLNYVYDSKNVLTFDDFKENSETLNAVIMKEASLPVIDSLKTKKSKIEALDTTGFLSTLFLASISGVNTSGRSVIWLNYLNFIDENLLFGNGSDKLMLKTIDQENKSIILIHAHNSFLELFASNGLILSLFFLLILFLNWTKKNFIFILPILFYSIFQYGIFWGISFLDVIFISILLSRTDFLKDESF